ncbi:MAG: 2Fe-2S iron-sulfur cluster-binding protein [Propionibacteriaceae bacterium]|nr:2Fe-2S iron-sulfur cluster-binding protein [Propionibacteriaceae bacterium]
MPRITIDGHVIEATEGVTILQAARQVGLFIPTLCYHPAQPATASCRICIVDVNGKQLLQPACTQLVAEGMVIMTNSPRVRQIRDTVLELIVSHHGRQGTGPRFGLPLDCSTCSINNQCDLQDVNRDLRFTAKSRFDSMSRPVEIDTSSASIEFDASKCIGCGHCEYTCCEVQSVFALTKIGRGYEAVYGTAYNKPLAETPCVDCGQCVRVCPVAAFTVKDDTAEVYKAINDPNLTVVAQISPTARLAILDALSPKPDTVSTGQLITALKQLGFDQVFDTGLTTDLAIMEQGTELLTRIKGEEALPMISADCPSWVKFCETYFPELLPKLSSSKSPQGVFGAAVKTLNANRINKKPTQLFCLSVVSCTAKKFEAKRPELGHDGKPDINAVITTQELVKMIKQADIDLEAVRETPFDQLSDQEASDDQVFTSSEGCVRALLRTFSALATGEEFPQTQFSDSAQEGVQETTLTLDDREIKVGVVHGLANARSLAEKVKAGTADYHFIYVMACPGGCLNGGGNIARTWCEVHHLTETV